MIEVRDTELGDAQAAARCLLAHGLVTEAVPGQREWRNVRRYASVLEPAFQELAGYRLVVTRTAVRLVRRRDRLRPAPVFCTPSGRPFDRVRYALLALALAALERAGAQTTLTDLARNVRRSADATEGLPFDPDTYPSRLALGHAVRELERRGALTLADGSREAWERGDGQAEALYDIDRGLCQQLFAGAADASLVHRDPAQVGRDMERRRTRQRLCRRLLEQPVVYLDDLDDAERALLQRHGRQLASAVERLTGGIVERRREGLALLDPGQRFSDAPFPSGGAAQQAALLVADRLCALGPNLPTVAAPHADERSDSLLAALDPTRDAPVRRRVARPLVTTSRLRELAAALVAELGPALKAAHREDPDALLADALEVLEAQDLVRPVPGGVALMPALARFRDVSLKAAEAELASQLGLFGGAA